MARIAVVVCTDHNAPDGVARPLLGLTVGERLMRTLAKGGISHVVFVGDGPRPPMVPDTVNVISFDNVPSTDLPIVVLPSDLVFDPNLLNGDQPLTDAHPIVTLSYEAASKLADSCAPFEPHLEKRVYNKGKGFALRVTDHAASKLAKRTLMLSLHKDADGIVSRNLNRKISTFISQRLAPLPIRPNHVTAVVFLVGLAAGPFAYLGTYLGMALGGFCYWFSAVLDGCDGEISRLKYQGSPLGAWLDTVVDDLVCLSYIVGMYISLHRNSTHGYWYYLGLVAVVFFVLSLLPRYYVMAKRGSGDYQKLAKVIRPSEVSRFQKMVLTARDVVFRTDFLPFAGMMTALFGYPEIFALPFAIGAPMTAIDSFNTLIKTQKES